MQTNYITHVTSSSSEASTNSDDSKTSSSHPLLPPCRICGAKASGFHYGANTCEACKGFFRRSLARCTEYKCVQGDGSCLIGPEKRSGCSHCRLQKCLALGMSKEAIKTGRYTHEKKTSDICEVKRLQRGNVVIERTDEQLEAIVKQILEAHRMQTPHTPEFFEKVPLKEKEFLEQRDLQQQTFGSMKPLARDEYMQIYQATGIDVDGRREMIRHMIPCLEKAIKRFIAFAKVLPGFKDLPIDDQITLIKASRLENWIVTHHRTFNPEKQLFTDVCGYTVDKEDLSKLHQPEQVDSVFWMANHMKKLQLTIEEICIYRGICLFQSDRGELQCPGQVDAHQALLINTMRYLARRSQRGRFFLPRLISLMVDMRNLADSHQHWMDTMHSDWSTEFNIPPLLYEICSC